MVRCCYTKDVDKIRRIRGSRIFQFMIWSSSNMKQLFIKEECNRLLTRLGICDSRFAWIRVQICVFLPTVGGEGAKLHPDSRKPRVTNPKSADHSLTHSLTYHVVSSSWAAPSSVVLPPSLFTKFTPLSESESHYLAGWQSSRHGEIKSSSDDVDVIDPSSVDRRGDRVRSNYTSLALLCFVSVSRKEWWVESCSSDKCTFLPLSEIMSWNCQNLSCIEALDSHTWTCLEWHV